MAEAGRDLWSPCGPNLLPKQGHPEWAAQDHIQVTFEDLRGGDNLSRQPVPVVHHPHSTEVLPGVEGISCALVCSHFLLSWPWAPWKRAQLCPLSTRPSRIDIH